MTEGGTGMNTDYKPCINGCVEEGTGAPRIAHHGPFCNREFKQADSAVKMLPGLMGHIVSLVEMPNRGSEKVDGTREPPAPGNEQALNDANETYRRMVYWASVWAKQMRVTAPAPAIGAWRNHDGTIVGLPTNVSPSGAQLVTKILADWFAVYLEAIFHLNSDDVNYFITDMRDVFRLNAKWPRKAKPRYSDVPCPIPGCGKKLAVFPPEAAGDDETIVCDAGHHIPPDRYEFYVRYYQDVQKERASAVKVRQHLDRKYGVAG